MFYILRCPGNRYFCLKTLYKLANLSRQLIFLNRFTTISGIRTTYSTKSFKYKFPNWMLVTRSGGTSGEIHSQDIPPVVEVRNHSQGQHVMVLIKQTHQPAFRRDSFAARNKTTHPPVSAGRKKNHFMDKHYLL